MKNFEKYGIVPVSSAVLESQLTEYKSPRNCIARNKERGILIRMKKGVYVVNPKVTGKVLSLALIANHIYGPSYVSMETALRYYGLIPESVYMIRSMTLKRSKEFKNTLAEFQYIHCKDEYYTIGIKQELTQDVTYLIATPEKALCDLIVYTPKLRPRFLKNMEEYLQSDLRFDMDRLKDFDIDLLKQLALVSKKKEEINNLIKIILR